MLRTSLIAAVVALFAGSASAQYFSEDFSSGVPPTGWTENNNGNSAGWEDDGTGQAWHDDYTGMNVNSLDSSVADLTGATDPSLTWDNTNTFATWTLANKVYVGTDLVWAQGAANGASGPQTVDMTAYAGMQVTLSFLYEGDYANDWKVDNVLIDAAAPPPPPSVTILFEDFESGLCPPPGWVENNNGNSDGWELWNAADSHIGQGHAVIHDDYNGYNLNSLIVGAGGTIDATNETGLHVEWLQDNHFPTWCFRNSVLVNGTEEWFQDATSVGSVSAQAADLSAHDGTMIELEFLYEGDYANEWMLDNIDLRATDGGGGGGFTLAVAGLVAGGSADLSLSGAGAGATCIMAYSLAGGGPTSTSVGDVDLSMPINRLPALTADANGDAGMSVSVPSGAAGVSVWIQAVDMSTSTLSNSVAETVG